MTYKKIIVIEDCPAQAKLAQLAFQELAVPNTIKHYANGYDFLEYINDHGTNDIAFVLLDLNMPEIHGKEVLSAVQANHAFKSLPIIIYSSSGHEDDIEDCYALGAKAYIKKPLNFFRFKEVLKKTHDFWVGENVQPGNLVAQC